MNAIEMGIVARMATHYERDKPNGDYEPLDIAESLFKQVKHKAPKLLRFLLDSKRSDREIGDWLWGFYGRWEKANKVEPLALKYFAEDELDRLGAAEKKTAAQLQCEIDAVLGRSAKRR